MKKYMLSTGESTSLIEKYILDLFRLNLSILPGDIPRCKVGFNFILTNVKKVDLKDELNSRVSSLISNIKSNFNSSINIKLESIELLNEEQAIITISVDSYKDTIEINILNENNTRLYK